MPSSKHGFREMGRELVFLSLYIYDLSRVSPAELSGFEWYDIMAGERAEEWAGEDFLFIPVKRRAEIYEFGKELLNGTISNLNKIDEIINTHLVKWSFNRLHSVDKAILRLSVYSIIYRYDIPAEVTISEANDLSNNYSDENTSNYINGILHKVKQEYRKNTLAENS
ncbi:MAG: transcription antitermination factor NusB [Brevinematales bacterium]|jgi:N utilization substance protein B